MYKPKRQTVEFKPSPNGTARVKVLDGNALAVWFAPTNENEFANKKFKVTDWPGGIVPKNLEGEEWYVRLTNDNKGIYSIQPIRGMFNGKVEGFSAKDGQEPTPKYHAEWKYPDYTFTVLLEITNDCPAKGMTVPYTLRYNFGEDEEGNVCYTKWGAQSKHTPLLDEFLTITGAWDAGPIQFTDNILSELQKRILRAGKSFQFVMKDGWISTLLESDGPVGEPKQSTYGEWEEADKEVEAVWNDEKELPAQAEPVEDDFDFGSYE